MNRKINTTFLNAFSSLLYQICLMFSHFITQRVILSYFGSEVNGLTATINQLLGYITLVEGGITGVLMARLYKPLHKKNYEELNSIIKTSTTFFRKITIVFILYSIALAIFYPTISNGSFSYPYTSILIIIQSLALLIQYSLSLSIRTLLNADKKVYIVSFTQIIISILSILVTILSVKIYPSIHILKLLTGVLYFIQPLIFHIYLRRHFKIDKQAKVDNQLLKSRWDGFAVNIAAFIHNCTDIVVLSIFTDLQTVSIYSVYSLVTMGIRSIIQSIARGITPTIGHSLAKDDKEKLKKDFDHFELIMFCLVFFTLGVSSFLITPFVLIYTDNVTDANYNQPLFGILILVSEICYLIREHHVSLAYSANKFKEITIPCFIEAGLNIIGSIILVKYLGLIGVAIGTILAMSYRSIYHIFLTKKIIDRSPLISLRNILIFLIMTSFGILFSLKFIPLAEVNLLSWTEHLIIYIIIFTITTTLSYLFLKIIKDYNKLIRRK